jgi:hypothetical protein
MRDEQDALSRDLTVLPQIDEVAAQSLGGQHIQGRERLIEQQNVGVDHQRPGEADTLAHAARQLLGIGGFEPIQPDQIDRRLSALAPLLLRHIHRLQPQLDIAEHGQPRKQGEALEYHPCPAHRPFDRVAAITHLAVGRLGQAGDKTQESGLARA